MRHSAVCTAAAPASSVPTARWLIREKNQLGLYLAWLYLISRCFLLLLLFSPCNFNLLTKVCAEQETDRQSERAIEMVRWGSAALPEPGLLLFLLTS